MSLDTSNKIFSLASDLVHYTSKNIFLTGKAGTGKTTFLKHIKTTCSKEMVVIAPTGVAAINAGGTTIHSFFQLPFSPFVPGHFSGSAGTEVNSSHSLIGRLKINTEKRNLFQALELLIIDEISMVRCDMMDAIDTVLRHFRGAPHLPFGGVQLLLIGDMHQLPPVIPDSEWNILSQFYQSPYFFSSKVITEHEPLFISFDKIYRQSDENFIQLLNAVRNNDIEEHHVRLLDSLYQPGNNVSNQNAIILTTHNSNADKINALELDKLKTARYTFKALIEGEFYEKYFPAEELLLLKPGAQVMFIKNDTEKIRRYFNGKIGVIKSIEQDKILVQCEGDEFDIEVKKEKWENIRYHLNATSKQVEEDVVGSFTQYPLRLAWAITIHKSQGLTFQKAKIDAGAAFSPGQVYVALSRCTGMEGLILKSKINYQSLKTDQRILEFSRNIASIPQIESQLQSSKKEYQQKLLLDLFDFSTCYKIISDLRLFITTEYISFNTDLPNWAEKLIGSIKKLQDVSYKFASQLHSIFQNNIIPQENAALQQRVIAASNYFKVQLENLLQIIASCNASTDSKQISKTFNEILYELYTAIHIKKFMFESCLNGFDGYGWHLKKKEFKLPSFKVNAYATNSTFIADSLAHPNLYFKLKTLRDELVNKTGKPVYLVANSQTLSEMSNFLPHTLDELAMINGFGKVRLKEFGEKFLTIIREYSEEYNLRSSVGELKIKKERKTPKAPKSEKVDTKNESFKLYKSGKTPFEISQIRNLSIVTIESHLAYYITTGEIDIQEMMSKDKLEMITPNLPDSGNIPLSEIKSQLAPEVTFGEIRMAMAWKAFQEKV